MGKRLKYYRLYIVKIRGMFDFVVLFLSKNIAEIASQNIIS